MGENHTSCKWLSTILYWIKICIIFIGCMLVVNQKAYAYTYNAISPAMSMYYTDDEEALITEKTTVSEEVLQTMETTNQAKFYEVILKKENKADTVVNTKSYVNYANRVTKNIINDGKITTASIKGAVISDKTKSLSVVGINEFNVQMRYGISLSELELFRMIVQAEAGCEDLKGKILVANVILNRVRSPKFPNSIRGVIMAPGQFQPVSNGRIYTVKVSSQTKLAVEMALQGEDYSYGATYFMARSASSAGNVTWFDRALTRVVKHGNHEFFK